MFAVETPRRSARIAARPPRPPTPPPNRTRARPPDKRKRRRRQAQLKEESPEPPRHGILFPVEIWKQVFEIVYLDGQERFVHFTRFLSALCREAESLLYSRPSIMGTLSAICFAKSTSNCPHRIKAVREISLKVSPQDQKHGTLYLRTMQAVFCKLAKLEVKLNSVDIQQVVARGTTPLPDLSLTSLLHDRTFPLRHLKGEPMHLDQKALQLVRTHCQQLKEVRLISMDQAPNSPSPATLDGVNLPNLCILGCDATTLRQIKNTRNITHLWIIDRSGSWALRAVIALLGMQLVSLRVDQTFRNARGSMYPTKRNVHWECCPKLKFLQLEDFSAQLTDYVRWDAGRKYHAQYMGHPPTRAPGKLPPVLETLVWTPVWTRHHMRPLMSEPNYTHRCAVRRFAEGALDEFFTLKEVIYQWDNEGYFHCCLSPEGQLLEGRADAKDADSNTWASVA